MHTHCTIIRQQSLGGLKSQAGCKETGQQQDSSSASPRCSCTHCYLPAMVEFFQQQKGHEKKGGDRPGLLPFLPAMQRLGELSS